MVTIVSIEFIAMCLISVGLLILRFIMRQYHLKWSERDPHLLMSLSSDMFLVIMPFFYAFRMPLILGILSNLSAIVEPNPSKFVWFKKCLREFSGRQNYTILNVSETQE